MRFSPSHARAVFAAGLAALLFLTPVAGAAPTSPTEPSRKPSADTGLALAKLKAVVGIHAVVPGDSRTAETLGTERAGSGVLIDSDGLVLTIGYLMVEAAQAWIVVDGERIPANPVAYDFDTGFGLLRAVKAPPIEPIRLGDSARLGERDQALVVTAGGLDAMLGVTVASKRPFAAYWEYLLGEAIFTVPPHHQFAGAALIGPDGRLLGIGSLFVPNAIPDAQVFGNMFVPINLLKPILADLLESGRAGGPVRPWLGISTSEAFGRLVVSRVNRASPAEKAGIREGDLILAVGGREVSTLAELYRAIWALGSAGVPVPLTVLHGSRVREVTVQSASRYEFLRLNRSN